MPSAPSAASTPPATESGSLRSTATPGEEYAGAVYQIPDTRTPAILCATVTAIKSLHLRAEPNEKSRVLAYLKAGEQVQVLELGSWWKIRRIEPVEMEAGGQTGYANAKYLQEGCEP